MKLFGEKKGAAQNQPVPAEAQAQTVPEQAEAQPETPPAPEQTVGEFSLSYEEEGVFLTLSSPRPLTTQEQERFIRHISRKRLQQTDMGVVTSALAGAWVEHVLVAPPQQEGYYDEVLSAAVSTDGMEATITMQAPEPVFGKRMSAEEITSELERAYRIVYGIDREALDGFIAAPVYDTPVVIARGTPPVPGEDGRLEWHVEQRDGVSSYRVKEVGEDEKVDYKNLDLFVQVSKDQLLVTRIPPKDGTPGKTVLGRDVPAERGKNYQLPRGKNTYVTQDGLQLKAGQAGRIEEVKGNLEVNTCYNVPGDVDMSVGNIDFDGDIIIAGNVLSGFTIKATGSVEVRGIVEGSVIEAGRDIVIMGGIQGAGKGMLTAKNEIYAKFAEYATLEAGKLIAVECLLHSTVSCFGAIEALSGRGSIIGGSVCAGTYIAANYYGNNSGRPTDLEVGISPSHRHKLAELEEGVENLKMVVGKLQEYVDELSDGGAKTDGEMRHRMETVKKLLTTKKMLQDAQDELDWLRGDMQGDQDGMVHALHTVHPGVNLTIGMARMRVDSPITFATFRQKDGNVEFTNCRFKSRPSRGGMKRRR